MSPTLAMIKRRFAGHDVAIERSFAASESFRGLCRDYLSCATALARWQESDAADAEVRVAEYSGLLAELAEEIQARLATAERVPNGDRP